MTTFATPAVEWRGNPGADGPLVVLLHGRGSNEHDIIALADDLPAGVAYAAVRAPISEGGGYAWFANRGIGRPVAESLADTMAWFGAWLDEVAPAGRPVVLVGFSGGAAFAGGLVLDDPSRYAGAAILSGTLPFDAGVPTTAGRLDGVPVLVAHGDADNVIPASCSIAPGSTCTTAAAPPSSASAIPAVTASARTSSTPSTPGSARSSNSRRPREHAPVRADRGHVPRRGGLTASPCRRAT